MKRNLIITADDFGASNNINEGIEIAAEKGVITTISALSNFTESLPLLKKISENHPEIGMGVHLNITTGKPILGSGQVPSLVDKDGNFYTIEKLLTRLNRISIQELRIELKAQILALGKYNIRIDHLSDQNAVLSFYGPFFEVLTHLAGEFHVPVRTPIIASLKYTDLFPHSEMNKHGHKIAFKLALNHPFRSIELLKYTRTSQIDKKVQILDNLGILHPDLLIDYFWGNPTESNLNYILEHLPNGTSELILHLGTETRQEKYPTGLELDYFTNREKELKIITTACLQETFNYLNINMIGYSDISKYKLVK